MSAQVAAEPTHVPCCSAHGVPMTCARYRRTHFVEVRPCCAIDAAALASETVSDDIPWDIVKPTCGGTALTCNDPAHDAEAVQS